MSRLFVTGLGSFIGRALARRAAAAGVAVVGVDAAAPDGDAWTPADIRDPEIASAIPAGTDALIHLAALSRDPDCRGRARRCFDVNVMGTLNLIDAAKARGVGQFVFASSEWVYDRLEPGVEATEEAPIDAANLASEYALSKFVSESNLRQQAAQGFCPATILRFGIVYGPRRSNWSAVEALLNTTATEGEIRIGARATARRFVHVDDVADGILAAVGWRRPFDVFNIQGGALVSLGEVIATASDHLSRTPRIVETDPDRPSIRAVSNRKAAAELNWTARIDLRQGIADVARHLDLAPTP